MNFTLVPNKEQVQKIIRWILTGLGAGAVGWASAKFNISGASIIDFFSSEAIAGVITMGITLALSLISGKTVNQIARVADMEAVKKIETTPVIAQAVPSPIVVPAPASKLSPEEKVL